MVEVSAIIFHPDRVRENMDKAPKHLVNRVRALISECGVCFYSCPFVNAQRIFPSFWHPRMELRRGVVISWLVSRWVSASLYVYTGNPLVSMTRQMYYFP